MTARWTPRSCVGPPCCLFLGMKPRWSLGPCSPSPTPWRATRERWRCPPPARRPCWETWPWPSTPTILGIRPVPLLLLPP
ncbi:hypothetical protein EYF80_062059 [Liparis tanakae]|uniref:Uncharacterized protein n=1 Tax=Liparis tanakae TaxID=230148 RepID=A0A4Z2EG93_9TELE|nr:hypothetical protein EYF80_062059 [Liparis tanakae]